MKKGVFIGLVLIFLPGALYLIAAVQVTRINTLIDTSFVLEPGEKWEPIEYIGDYRVYRWVLMPVVRHPAIINVPEDYPTIQAAINAAKPGDIINVSSGTYYERIVVNKTLSLVGESRDTTIIDGGEANQAVISVTASNVEISGFTIRNSSLTLCPMSDFGGILLYNSSNNVIRNNNISKNGIGIIIRNADNNIISDNKLSGNHFSVEVDFSDHNTVSNNVISGKYTGIGIWGGSYNGVSSNTITTDRGSRSFGMCIETADGDLLQPISSEGTSLLTTQYQRISMVSG